MDMEVSEHIALLPGNFVNIIAQGQLLKYSFSGGNIVKSR
jgi:hypothetical protein